MRFRTTLALTLGVLLLPGTGIMAQVRPLAKPVGHVQQASHVGCSCGAAAPGIPPSGCTSCCDQWQSYDSCGSCGPGACGLIPPCGPICCGSAIVGELLCGVKNSIDRKLSCLFSCCLDNGCGPGPGYVDGCCDDGCADCTSGGFGPGCGAAPVGPPWQAAPITPMSPTPAATNGDPFQNDPLPVPQPSAGSTTRRPVYSIRRTSVRAASHNEPVRGNASQPARRNVKRVGTGVLDKFMPKRNPQLRRAAGRQVYTGSKPLVRFQD